MSAEPSTNTTDTVGGVERFFAFARARHEITLRRAAGLPRSSWTDDPILQEFRFTNVFREMDRTTVWIAQHVRRHLDRLLELEEIEPWQTVLGVILARTFNRVETLEQLFGSGPGFDYIRGRPSIHGIENWMRRNCPKPWVTGAYIVKTPDGMDKLEGALWIVQRAAERLPDLARDRSFACSMQALHADLVTFPYLGGFTAYEIVSDLRWMVIGREWPDIMSWAHAGPGAVRGLNRVHGREHARSLSQPQALAEMRDLLREAGRSWNWPHMDDGRMLFDEDWASGWPEGGVERTGDWPIWEMREIEHTLCEFDKYERVRLGQGRPRGVYR